MKITVKRIFKGDTYTIGKLYVNDEYECDTLEDPDRGITQQTSLEGIAARKIKGETAIPTGTYEITMNVVSPKFKDRSWAKFCGGKLPRLMQVPGFEGVLIHTGNSEKDSSGCLLVGQNKVKGQVINSTATFKRLYEKMEEANKRGEKITITIS